MINEEKPEKKKMGTGSKVAIGCGVVLVIGIIVLAVALVTGVQFLSKKAEEAGIDADLIKKNPALATAKMIVAANPELELVEVDEKAGTVTIRNKKTGEKLTVDFEDIEKGRLTFKTDEGEMTFSTDESGAGVKLKDEKGEVKSLEFGKTELPDWMPLFPGELNIDFTISDEESRYGNFTIKTDSGAEKVRDFYVSKLENLGLSTEVSSFETDDTRTITIISSDDDKTREISININQEKDGKSLITVNYQIKI